jgi:predicted Zn-dependent protease
MDQSDRMNYSFRISPTAQRSADGTTIMATQRIFAAVLVALSLVTGGHAVAQSAADKEGVRVGNPSFVRRLVPAETLEKAASQQYGALKREAQGKGALLPPEHPQNVRLRTIARDLLPHADKWNPRAKDWKWEVVLINSGNINAFCMPGGKIAFFTGILDKLKLTDDEVAMVMGHEIAHALREHGRERAGKAQVAQGLTIGASILSQLFGYGDLGGYLASGAAQLTMMKFGRDDETEADLVGMDIAARAGFDPRASIVLWQKMAAASKGQPPQWLSTHPSHDTRIEELRRNLQATLPVYARTRGVAVGALPAYRSNFGEPVR